MAGISHIRLFLAFMNKFLIKFLYNLHKICLRFRVVKYVITYMSFDMRYTLNLLPHGEILVHPRYFENKIALPKMTPFN